MSSGRRTAAGTAALCATLLVLGCGEFRQVAPTDSDRTGAGGAGNQTQGSGGRASGKAGVEGSGNGGEGGGASGNGANRGQGGNNDPIDGPGASCNVGETRCTTTGQAGVEVCTVGGRWMMQKTCSSLCKSGECSGSCTPDDKQCGAGQKPATCSQDGDWIPADPCPNVCTGKGECTGDCKPGASKCGDGGDKLVPYECDDQGKWIGKTACMNVCSNGSCGGSCMATKTRCVGNTPQTCSALGTWEPSLPCKGKACVDGMCTGLCEPKAVQCGSTNNLQTCDANGAWTEGSVCTGKTCVKGACVGACEPNAPKRCSPDQKATQTCGAGGVWTNIDSCADRGCTGMTCNVCKPNSKVCMGKTLRKCNAAGSGFDDEPCVVSCDAAKLACNNDVSCNPACNANPHCGGTDKVISESCDTTKGQCVATTKETCSGGKTCQGNSCACSPNMGKPCNEDTCNPGTFDCAGTACINGQPKKCPGDQVCGNGQCACPQGKTPGPGTTCCSGNVGKPCNENTCTPGTFTCAGICANPQPKNCPSPQVCNAGQCGCVQVPNCDSTQCVRATPGCGGGCSRQNINLGMACGGGNVCLDGVCGPCQMADCKSDVCATRRVDCSSGRPECKVTFAPANARCGVDACVTEVGPVRHGVIFHPICGPQGLCDQTERFDCQGVCIGTDCNVR